jgi:hypothetical protein
MQNIEVFFQALFDKLGTSLPNLLAALLILIIGWIVARLIAGSIRKLLRRTNLDNRLAKTATQDSSVEIHAEDWIAKGIFFVLMIFVLVAFFQRLGLTSVTGPLNTLLDTVMGYLPQLASALILLLVAWLVATIVKMLVSRGATMLKLDDRLSSQGALQDEETMSVSDSIASAAYWLVFLFFLPPILNSLRMNGLVGPMEDMISKIMDFIPNIFGAAIILLVGWFIARIVRQIVVSLLVVAGVNKLGDRIGLSRGTTLAGLLGTIVYAFILIPAVISALDTLAIDAISNPASMMLSTLLDAIPRIFGAVVVLGVAYLVGRLISGLVVEILDGVGINQWPEKIGLNLKTERSLAEIIGYIILVATVLFAGMEAAEMLGFGKFSELVNAFIVFGGKVLLALVIFGVGLYIANLARDIMLSTMGEDAAFTISIVRAAILVLVTAMALSQMGIAQEIVNDAFTILLAAIGIAIALAFGLGSREIAGKEVARWLESTRK